ncbi:MAG: metallophosphatase domain-containing protein [Myxococcaceae bacterium]
MRIVAVADTHNHHAELQVPDGDLFIHAGDLTNRGTRAELERVADWMRALPHRHKVFIAGNHDFLFQDEPEQARALFEGVTYLLDSEVTVGGVRVWGSPWQPWFHDWAFNLHRGAPLDAVWKKIPAGVDVLVTHGPPLGYGDLVYREERVGCEDLLRHLPRVGAKLHLFGHIHEDRGEWQLGKTRIVNCTTGEGEFPPTVIDL